MRAYKFLIPLFLIGLWSMQDLPAYAKCGNCPGDPHPSTSAPAAGGPASSEAATVPTTQSTTGLNSPAQVLPGDQPPTVSLGANAGLTHMDMPKEIDNVYKQPPGSEGDAGSVPQQPQDNRGIEERKDADGSTVRAFTDSQGRLTREERVYGRGGARAITDYEPVTGKRRSEFRTSASGHPKWDAQYDGRTGMKISETQYDANGMEKDHRTWDPDGTQSSAIIREDDGTITRQIRIPGEGSVISRTRPDGSLISTKEDTGPMQSRVREFDNKNNMTSEQNVSHGMATSKTTYGENGPTKTEFYPDGSVKSQTKTTVKGETTADYPAGKYFESDGNVKQIP